MVRDVNTLLNVLVPILDKNPLRTVKYLDYLDFKRILLLLNIASSTAVTGQDKVLATDVIKE